MKTISRLLAPLLILAVVFGAMTLTAGAAELSGEDAAAYLDDYASNVGSDPDFDANITAAITAGARYKIGHGHGPVHHFHALWASPETEKDVKKDVKNA